MSVHSFTPPRPWTEQYADGVPDDLGPISGSLVDLVKQSAHDYPNAPALEFFGATIDYSQLMEQIERAAEGLRRLGVQAGDRVGLVMPNSPQHIVAFYAVLRLGAIVVEHNPLYTPHELKKQFGDHGATTAITWTKGAAAVQSFATELGITRLIAVDVREAMPWATRLALRLPVAKARESNEALHSNVTGVIDWKQIVTSPRLDPAHPYPASEDTAVLQYTSGTTGTPKGAVLSHRNLLANARQAQSWPTMLSRGEGCVFYAVLPMFHAYGLTLCVTFAMSMAARLVLFPKFDPDQVLKVTAKHPASVLPVVPPIAERLVARAKETGASLKGTQVAISGAMALPQHIVAEFEAASGGFLVEGYGLSECSPVLMVNPLADNRTTGSIGLPLPGTECRVVDPDNPTQDVEPGEPGELIVRGPQVFSGYYNKPEESAAVFVDGWFRTGDTVVMSETGFFRVVDRLKELIITGGFNVAPTEVEQTLNDYEGIAESAVVGMPSSHSGEDVVAAVVVEPGVTLDTEAVRTYARERLTPYKVPRRVVIVDELPKSMIGKIMRRKVKEQLLAGEDD